MTVLQLSCEDSLPFELFYGVMWRKQGLHKFYLEKCIGDFPRGEVRMNFSNDLRMLAPPSPCLEHNIGY